MNPRDRALELRSAIITLSFGRNDFSFYHHSMHHQNRCVSTCSLLIGL